MATSEARIFANQMNAKRSTGPTSTEGKNRSRRNSLKHGLSGEGVVLPEDVRNQVEDRLEALEAELDPQTAVGEIMVEQMARLSVRMTRGAKQESAAIAKNVRHAVDAFDDGQLEEVERLFEGLGENPRVHLRKLMKSPEGVERLIEAWQDLRALLTRSDGPGWTATDLERSVNLSGNRLDQARGSRIVGLSKAVWDDFSALSDQDGGHLDRVARKAWARSALVEQIDAEIAVIESHYETLDFEMLEQDRAEAGDRALFDPSKEACLARRYESEASRGFFKAYEELKRVEAEAAIKAEAAPAPATAPVREVARSRELLGSFREASSPRPLDLKPASDRLFDPKNPPVLDRDGKPLSIGRAVPVMA